MQTEIAFRLPKGYVDDGGKVHRDGTMRLATALDEIEPLRSAEVRQNHAYLTILLLARTITRIGDVTAIGPDLVAGLYAADFDHLQRLYERVNSCDDSVGVVSCPACRHDFEFELTEVEHPDRFLAEADALAGGGWRGI